MKKIASDLKRMFAALTYEDACENMSLRNKKEFLGAGHVPTHTPVHSSIHSTVTEVTLHEKNHPQAAVIFDGHASDQVMKYILNTPYIFNTEVIILAHGQDPELEQKVISLSSHLTEAGREHSVAYLLQDMEDAFQEFCNNNPDLQFLVSPKDDLLAKEIIHNPEFHSHSHEIPLILIQDSERKAST